MFPAAAAAAGPQKLYNPNNDVELQPIDAIKDGVSSLCFSPRPVGNNWLLVATTWDNNVMCWEVTPTGQSQPKALMQHTQPVLCSCWSADGSTVFTGSCDKTIKMWNPQTNQTQQVGQHDAPVRHCFFVQEHNLLVTGSWDKTLRYWDLRSPGPVHTQQLPERVYAMDVKSPLMVVGLADKQIQIYHLSNPQTPFKTLPSPLKWQTRCISCFPDKQGYLVGSIEGRVAVQHVDDAVGQTKNFTFKCHRDNTDIYAVNSLAFHPEHGTFVTTGSDGTYNFWDKDSKQRLKAMAKCQYAQGVPGPIPCGAFNPTGSIYAYGVSYDWSKGFAEYNPNVMKNYVLLHAVQESEAKSRQKTAATAPGRK